MGLFVLSQSRRQEEVSEFGLEVERLSRERARLGLVFRAWRGLRYRVRDILLKGKVLRALLL